MSIKHTVILVLLFTILFVVLNLSWLTLFLLPIAVTSLRGSIVKATAARTSGKTRPILFYLIVGFASVILMRLFVVEMFTVPTSSMQQTLLPGDRILASKLAYGPRLPRGIFDIPWVSAVLSLNASARHISGRYQFKYNRLSGYSSIKRGDIIVFNHPDDRSQFVVKRCVAGPGDTVQILNGLLYINGQQQIQGTKLMKRNALIYNDRVRAFKLLNALHIPFVPGISEGRANCVILSLDSETREDLSKSEWVDEIFEMPVAVDTVSHAYPWTNSLLWTEDTFGPVVVPKKGMKIEMTERNFYIYKKIFERSVGLGVDHENSLKEIQSMESYVFPDDYYFMMGDNRNDSRDSRHWGFVPEDHIVGKAIMILFTAGDNAIKWRRTCKLL